MEQIFSELAQNQESGKPCVLCIVTEVMGSTPRKAGAKMLVYPGGSISGTIGGGTVEWNVIGDALKIFESRTPVTKQYHLEDDLSMHCGGTMTVYMEPVGYSSKLFIFGSGHVGKSLANYASGLGFSVTVIDNRKDIFNQWNHPRVTCIVAEYLDYVNSIKFDKDSYIVIVTPGHQSDEDILLACAGKTYAYIGMIGSKNKVAMLRKKILDNQLLDPAILEKIDMPIGVPILSETPCEIAVSIVARLIDVRNRLKKS